MELCEGINTDQNVGKQTGRRLVRRCQKVKSIFGEKHVSGACSTVALTIPIDLVCGRCGVLWSFLQVLIAVLATLAFWWVLIPVYLILWSCSTTQPSEQELLCVEDQAHLSPLTPRSASHRDEAQDAASVALRHAWSLYKCKFADFVRARRGADAVVSEETRVSCSGLVAYLQTDGQVSVDWSEAKRPQLWYCPECFASASCRWNRSINQQDICVLHPDEKQLEFTVSNWVQLPTQLSTALVLTKLLCRDGRDNWVGYETLKAAIAEEVGLRLEQLCRALSTQKQSRTQLAQLTAQEEVTMSPFQLPDIESLRTPQTPLSGSMQHQVVQLMQLRCLGDLTSRVGQHTQQALCLLFEDLFYALHKNAALSKDEFNQQQNRQLDKVRNP